MESNVNLIRRGVGAVVSVHLQCAAPGRAHSASTRGVQSDSLKATGDREEMQPKVLKEDLLPEPNVLEKFFLMSH